MNGVSRLVGSGSAAEDFRLYVAEGNAVADRLDQETDEETRRLDCRAVNLNRITIRFSQDDLTGVGSRCAHQFFHSHVFLSVVGQPAQRATDLFAPERASSRAAPVRRSTRRSESSGSCSLHGPLAGHRLTISITARLGRVFRPARMCAAATSILLPLHR